jgi:hypothetical protein
MFGCRDRQLEVVLERFDRTDVNAIRSIPGRRWLQERRVWVLPHTRVVLDALKQSFGSRLRFVEAPRTGPDHASQPTNEVHVRTQTDPRRAARAQPQTGSTGGAQEFSRARDADFQQQIGDITAGVEPAVGKSYPTNDNERLEPKRIIEARQAIRIRDYSRKTELAYIAWVQRFLRFNANVGRRGTPEPLARQRFARLPRK